MAGPAGRGGVRPGARALKLLINMILLASDSQMRGGRDMVRGRKLLDRLDEIRFGLLTGGLPRGTLVRLAQELGEQREGVTDPKLSAILDEIELRARVELAKYDAARSA